MKTNKKKILLFSILTLIFVIGLFVLFKNVNPKKIKGSVSAEENYDETINSGFKACVVNAYNKENNTNYPWDYDLTDEQLSTIKKLDCMGGANINSVKEAFTYYLNEENDFYYFQNYERKQSDFTDEIEKRLYNYPEYLNSFITYSIEGIEKLTNLEELYILYPNKVEGENVITLPTSLKTFYLYTNNGITIKGAENLENLFINYYYDYYDYPITFESDLSKLKALYSSVDERYLKINYSSLTSLEEVTGGFDDYTFLNNSPNLKKVITDYDNHAITNFDEIKFWDSVEYLVFGVNSDMPAIPDMPNVKTLIMHGGDNFSNMPKIENLFLDSSIDLETLDLSNYSNTLKRLVYDGSVDTLEAIKGFEKLNKLEYLSVNSISETALKGLEKLTSLKELVTVKPNTGSVENITIPSLEKFAGEVSDYSIFPNLKYLITHAGSAENLKRILEETGSISSSDNVYLEKLYLSDGGVYDNKLVPNDENFSWPENIKLKTFHTLYDANISASLLEKMKSIEKLTVGYLDKNVYDFSNNVHLKELKIGIDGQPLNFKLLTNLQKLALDGATGTFDFSNSKDLSILAIWSEYDPPRVYLEKNVNLKYIAMDYARNLNLEKLKDLRFLKVDEIQGSLRVSNSNNLDILDVGVIVNTGNLLNTEFDIKDYIQLPEKYIVNVDSISDESLVQRENDKVFFKKTGDVSITYDVTGIHGPIEYYDLPSDSPEATIQINTTIFDVDSKKMTINKEKDFILTNSLLKEKNIIKDIKYLSTITPTPYSVVDKNNLNMLINRNIMKKLKLIKVTSRKYDIKDNNIYYNGEFNIDNVKVTNANKNVNNDKLEIIFDNEVVKTYNLIKKENLIGDVNGDGKVSITDISMQYKHVKYVLDLIDDYHYRADLNSDEDVSISDVSSLYKLIKRN